MSHCSLSYRVWYRYRHRLGPRLRVEGRVEGSHKFWNGVLWISVSYNYYHDQALELLTSGNPKEMADSFGGSSSFEAFGGGFVGSFERSFGRKFGTGFGCSFPDSLGCGLLLTSSSRRHDCCLQL